MAIAMPIAKGKLRRAPIRHQITPKSVGLVRRREADGTSSSSRKTWFDRMQWHMIRPPRSGAGRECADYGSARYPHRNSLGSRVGSSPNDGRRCLPRRVGLGANVSTCSAWGCPREYRQKKPRRRAGRVVDLAFAPKGSRRATNSITAAGRAVADRAAFGVGVWYSAAGCSSAAGRRAA